MTTQNKKASITIEDVYSFFNYMEDLREKEDVYSQLLYESYTTQMNESYFIQNEIHGKYLDKIQVYKEHISDLSFTLGKLEVN